VEDHAAQTPDLRADEETTGHGSQVRATAWA
jgi:hypothetical protein